MLRAACKRARVGPGIALSLCLCALAAAARPACAAPQNQQTPSPLRFVAHLVLYQPKQFTNAFADASTAFPRIVSVAAGAEAYRRLPGGLWRHVGLGALLPQLAPLAGFGTTDPHRVLFELRRVDDRWDYFVAASVALKVQPGGPVAAGGAVSPPIVLREVTSGAPLPQAVVWYRAAWVVRALAAASPGWVRCEEVSVIDRWGGKQPAPSLGTSVLRERPVGDCTVPFAMGPRVELWDPGEGAGGPHRVLRPGVLLIEGFWPQPA